MAWRSKAQTSNGMARKRLEKQWLCMQGVALISGGEAARGKAMKSEGIA